MIYFLLFPPFSDFFVSRCWNLFVCHFSNLFQTIFVISINFYILIFSNFNGPTLWFLLNTFLSRILPSISQLLYLFFLIQFWKLSTKPLHQQEWVSLPRRTNFSVREMPSRTKANCRRSVRERMRDEWQGK